MQKFVVLALILATSYATLSSFSVTDTFGSTTAGYPIYGANNDAIKLLTNIGDFNGDGRNDYALAGGATRSTIYIVLGQAGGRAAALDLGTADSTKFYSFQLAASEVASGLAAGDINGDNGIDLAVGVTGGVKVYVFYGKGATTWTTWAAPTIPITDPRQGFTVTTSSDMGIGGETNMAFQDFLGDTKEDLLLGMPKFGTNKGAICVIAGRANVNAATGASTASERGTTAVNCDTQTTLDNTDKWEGKQIIGAANDKIGTVVAAGTDMTSDGNDDVLVGLDGVAKAYLVYGVAKVTATPTATYGPELDLATAANRLEITLPGAIRSAKYIGDFNGDGKDDLALGYSAAALASRVYVLFGQGNKYTSLTPPLDLTSGSSFTTTYGITYSNPTSGDYFGWVVDGADVNADGISDLIVSAPLADGASRTAAGAIGKVHIIYGSKSNTASVNLNTAGLNGITISGVAATGFGTTLAAIPGGVSGDAIADLIVSAPSGSKSGGTATGIVYELRGQAITPSGSGFRLHFSVLAFASILVALMF